MSEPTPESTLLRHIRIATDPAVLDAMQDALVRAGRLRESLTVAWDGDQPDMSGQPQRARAGSFRSRETADRAAAYYRTRGRDAVVERCLVTDWQEIPDE